MTLTEAAYAAGRSKDTVPVRALPPPDRAARQEEDGDRRAAARSWSCATSCSPPASSTTTRGHGPPRPRLPLTRGGTLGAAIGETRPSRYPGARGLTEESFSQQRSEESRSQRNGVPGAPRFPLTGNDTTSARRSKPRPATAPRDKRSRSRRVGSGDWVLRVNRGHRHQVCHSPNRP